MWCRHKFIDLMYGRSCDMIKIRIKSPFFLHTFFAYIRTSAYMREECNEEEGTTYARGD